MDLGLRSMAPTNVCISQPPRVYLDQYSSFAIVMPTVSGSPPKACGFNAWTDGSSPPHCGSTEAEQRPTILFQLLQHEDLSTNEFHQKEHIRNASEVDLDDKVQTSPGGKPSRSFSTSAESTRMTVFDISRSPSQGSVASSDGTLEDGLLLQLRPRPRLRAESFLESTRTQLVGLMTRCSPFKEVEDESLAAFPVHTGTCSAASEVQSSPPATRRRSATTLCRPRRSNLGPIDLTCKRRCSRDNDVTWEPGTSRVPGISREQDIFWVPDISKEQCSSREPDISEEPGPSGEPYEFSSELRSSTESGISRKFDRVRCCRDADPATDETSILKSILTGRSRSQSFSGAVARLPVRHQTCVPMATSHQRVALAKRNMMPVLARIADRLSGAIGFARSLPEFLQFPVQDQVVLLVQACPRLLLLYLAEENFQFAVTSVRSALDSEVKLDLEEPTMQFVEMVQNFIAKCQAQAIGSTEFFYMRLIILFHTGSAGVLLRSDLAKRISSEAVQDLHALVGHLHGNDKLRYSRLLLTLYTLFGINGSMVEALFCSQISSLGGMRAFVEHELRNAASSGHRSPADNHGEI